MICQSCGREAPTRKVFFVQHIGAIIMFFHKRIGGMFCRDCASKYFSEYFGITLLAGWWGVISIFATPIVLIIDIANYFRYSGMEPVPADAAVPVLTNEAIGKLQPLTTELVERLNRGDDFQSVMTEIAKKARVTPGQVVRYFQALIEAQKQRTA